MWTNQSKTDHGLESILIDSVNTPELEVSIDEADAMSSLASSEVLYLEMTHSDNSRVELLSSTKCHTLWCQNGACQPLV